MPLFRRRQAPVLPRTSSISVYGQGRAQALQKSKHSDKSSLSGSFSSIDLDDRPHPLAFAEATFDPSLPIKQNPVCQRI
ncbi:a-kinase anchor protein 10, mitochondrial [Trichonephila clavata]|uniref:A-kinase anchor protein 10, mitochondrial n=1 Tax=Trichonephila clavata TaxID=2740835 RepID=A0A8X6FIZ1_TRICU|nr:a-kinase anchor protein 10, mitochondrial [Trichonephila clavata]